MNLLKLNNNNNNKDVKCGEGSDVTFCRGMFYINVELLVVKTLTVFKDNLPTVIVPYRAFYFM